MIDLKAKSAAHGMFPLRLGALSADEAASRPIFSIAPFKGSKVDAALVKALGIGLPDAGASTRKGDVEILWVGRGQYFLIGAAAPKLPAAVTDQSDAWCSVRLAGEEAGAVMARLCPVQLDQLQEGQVVRSLVGHMSAIIVKRSGGFEVMVFRAFAKTLADELRAAMVSVNAQAALPD
ncbi:sarcosine oxidase subunit gamma [uncultured Litoreibacter sp.]|uniref:sarcosine oxidase subunit gamma n=1 Tax=uncultured Litoreibacter sp. TaxID=1392394 RepID=UPI0026302597|nr:sarcosine oxidase subunit gamma [uncultured Litoreibacter sp.]